MYYIVGLGNPGEKYERTRHNVGWLVVDDVIEKCGLPVPVNSSKYAGRVSEGVAHGHEVAVLYPDTFMNKSGSAVVKLVPKTESRNLIVVYDDVDLAIGEIKVSVGRGDGGHNGIKSIIASLGTKDFVRIRVGIAPKSFWTGKVRRPAGGAPMTRHVLGRFSTPEIKTLTEVKTQVHTAIELILSGSIEKAMNECN